MRNNTLTRCLSLVAIGCCLAVAFYLCLWDGLDVRASEPALASTHTMQLPLIYKMRPIRHRQGDWAVDGTEVVQNRDVLLDGNLTVQNGGRLVLRNARLTLNATSNGQYSIRVEAGGALTIEAGSIITATYAAAHFSFVAQEGSQFVIRDSELHGCGWGTEYTDPLGPTEPAPISWDVTGLFLEADGALVERNIFSHNFGALVLAGTGATVRDNVIVSNVYNPLIVLGSGNTIRGNDIHHVPRSGFSRHIDVYGSQNSLIGNTLSSELDIDATASGIVLFHSWSNTIADNVLVDLKGGGIGMAMHGTVSGNNVIAGNTVSCGESALNIHGPNNLVQGNTVSSAETGIEVMYSYDNVIADNTLAQIGSLTGIRLTHSSGNTIVNNHISEIDSEGILLWDSSKDNLIQGNMINSTYRGLAIFYDSDNNVIRDNVISGTTDAAILLDSVSDNVAYRNNFVGASRRPYDDGANRWDQDGVGNYWSEYAGTDPDGDGIGDQPYDIGPDGLDRYPLVEAVAPQPATVTAPPTIPFEEPLEFIHITGEEVWERQALTLETQITIQEGGSLTLREVTLTLGSEVHPAFISVNPGGRLYIYDSRIATSARGNGGRLMIEDGATFVMQDSHVRGIYYAWWNEGFEIYGGRTILSGNIFTGVSISLVDVSSATIVSNTIMNTFAPLWVNGGEHVTVTDNEFVGSIWWAANFSGQESHSNLIARNTFSEHWEGAISLWEGTALVADNEIRRSGRGVMVYSNGNEVLRNRFSDNYAAITLVESSGNQVLSNTISDSVRGVQFLDSSENTFAGNHVLSSTNVSLEVQDGSHSNTIVSNTIAHSEHGAFLDTGTWGNLLHHNNFISNTEQAEDQGPNQWDDGQQGNHWSDYTGTDTDADGIGDTPYAIPPSGVDRYPLMAPCDVACPSVWSRRWLAQLP